MARIAFDSNNEEAILKSNGPFRVQSTDKSVHGVLAPVSIPASRTLILGNVTIHGERVSGPSTGQPPNEKK